MSTFQLSMPDAALMYAQRGWRIVPVHDVVSGRCSCGRANCGRGGKHPRVKSWTEKASTDEVQIRKWWSIWPNANIGVATGVDSGIIVLDVDGDEGRSTLGQLAGDDPSLLETLMHMTGSGGSHLFYLHPGSRCANGVKPLPGIDVRGDNGLIILPPSQHSSGNRYQTITELPVASLPESIYPLFQTASACHKERQGRIKSDEERQRASKQVGEIVVAKRLSTDERRQQLAWALHESLPSAQGKRHRQVFELARYLLSVDGVTQDLPIEQLRPIVEKWHQLAVNQAAKFGFEIHGDVEETWSDFQFAWGRVKYPVGSGLLKEVFEYVDAADKSGCLDPVVINSLQYFGRMNTRAMRLLIGSAYELSQRQPGQPFSLSCHAAAQQLVGLGIMKDHKWVYRRLKSFVLEGVLCCADSGQGGVKSERRAAQYRWTWSIRERPHSDLNDLLTDLM